MRHSIILATCLLTASCATYDDPAQGGFVSGLKGVSSGSYQARVDAQETQLASETSRTAALEQERLSLLGELDDLKRTLAQQTARIQSSGQTIPQSMQTRLNALEQTPSVVGTTDERVAQLKKSIQDAAELSALLAEMSG